MSDTNTTTGIWNVQWEIPVKDDESWYFLYFSYGFGILMLLPFLLLDYNQGCDWFAWFWAQCHRSRRTEQLYLVVAVGIPALGGICWKYAHSSPKGMSNCNLYFLLRCVACILMVDIFVSPGAHAKFYDGDSGRALKFRRQQNKENNTYDKNSAMKASMASATGQLKATVGEALVTLLGKKIGIPQEFVPLTIFIILLPAEFALNSDMGQSESQTWGTDNATWVVRFYLFAFFVLCLSKIVYGHFASAPKLFNIGIILDFIIKDISQFKTEEERKENMHFVLTEFSVGSMMEVCEFKLAKMLIYEDTQGQGLKKRIRPLFNTSSTAILIDALQRTGLRFNMRFQEAVKDLFLTIEGEEMTKLKALIDAGNSYHNMQKLLYSDISNQEWRREMLDHITTQADIVRTNNQNQHISTHAGEEDPNGGRVGVKILSDVDDTLYSSGGSFPAGCDSRYPKHTVYPGCLQLFHMLDEEHQRLQKDEDHSRVTCNVAFLSARPHVSKDYAERHSYELFGDLCQKGKMHAHPTLLPGGLQSSFGAMVTVKCRGSKAWRSVGEHKFKTFLQYRAMYPEYDFVFFGDNGQGDLLCADKMCTRVYDGPSNFLGAFIHEVQDSDKALRDPCHKSLDGSLVENGPIMYKSYVGAALRAFEKGIINSSQLAMVYEGTNRDIETAGYGVDDDSDQYHFGNDVEHEMQLTALEQLKEDLSVLGMRLDSFKQVMEAERYDQSTFNEPAPLFHSFASFTQLCMAPMTITTVSDSGSEAATSPVGLRDPFTAPSRSFNLSQDRRCSTPWGTQGDLDQMAIESPGDTMQGMSTRYNRQSFRTKTPTDRTDE